jgi:ketosteroid isomerase-like protein
MRIHLIIILIAFFIVSCSEKPDMVKLKQEIVDLLNLNAECYRNKDLDCIMNTYMNDSTTIALGTERNFIGIGFDKIKELYKNDLSQNWTMNSYEYKNPVINIHGDVAWLTADVSSSIKVNLQGSEFDIQLDSRLTAVCRKIGNEWKFVMTNFQHFKNPADALNEMQKSVE